MKESFLTRLASYSQNPTKLSIENFLTEVMAYVINTDRVFRHTFVGLVIPKRSMQRRFRNASALPQQTIGKGIVDLVLELADERLLVEVKVGARETETKIYGQGWVPQIRKYLSNGAGCVAYLTTRNVPSPDVKSKFFLGHFLIESLYGRLDRKRLSPLGQLLLDFMEENDMKALEPFSKTDLSNAVHAFSFARKCEEILDEVAKDVGPEINKIFKKKSRLTSGHFSPTYESAYCSTRKFKYGVATRIYLSLDPSDGELGFCVSARISRKHMHSVNRHLKWEQYQSEL